MEEEIVKSVKSLVGIYESASKKADKIENRINHDVHSDIEMLKQSPIVATYRHRLQKELDELVKMRVQLETGEREVNRDHSEERVERPSVGVGRSATPDEAFQAPCFRSKVLHSSSTISGYRKRPQIPARATFLRNVGIVCATKTVDNEASESKKNQAKLQKVLQEIVSTERVYVKRLSVLDISFREALSKFNREEYLFQWDSWNQMFSNLPNIRKFHEENLLPLMEQCLRSHTNDSLPKTYIGKVFSDLAPYLKMYSEYAQNYKRCLDILNTTASESPKLQKLILDFEAQDICEGLKVRYFYIEPIQRLPRYELLLREYTSCLSDDSEDLVNGHIALKMVKQANIHSNDTIKNEENFFKIAEIEDCLRDSVDLVSSPRKFIREGNVDTVLPIRGRIESRKLFLFSDLLLICQYYPHPFRPPYCVTDKLDVNLFQVKEVRDRIFLFGPQAIVELLPRSPEDRLAWKKDLESVAKNNEPERLNLVGPGSPLVDHKKQPSLKKTVSIKTRPLGVVAPIMMKEQEVQACMECTEEFGILNRKRSCFACGRVVCRQCAEYKEPLAYLSFEIKRVCNKCHELLQASPNIPTMF